MRGLVAALLLVSAGCYSPSIAECTITCGSSGGCPSELTCMPDGYCHNDIAVDCFGLEADGAGSIDGPMGADARVADARPQPDGRLPDARQADARPEPDAGGTVCTNSVEFVEETDADDSLISNLSVSPTGHVHITYYEANQGILKYAHRASPTSKWEFQEVAPAADNLKGQTLDSTGAVHVAFTDNSSIFPRLQYARRSPQGVWKVETIDTSALGVDASVVVDASLRVHVAYWYNLSELEYATRAQNGTSWDIQTIDDQGTVGEHPSIALGPNGLAVSYRIAGTSNDLGLARRSGNGGSWVLTRPDTTGNVGSYTALAVDTTNGAHIAYSDFTNGQLKYAFIPAQGPGIVSAMAVEPGVGVGRFNSLVIDQTGGIHISYYAYGDQNLRYAVKRPSSASFAARTLDAVGNVGRHSSIGVDGNGGIHISYIDDTNGDLKYAHICP